MPETRPRRVSSQRFLPAVKFVAVALCATAFLLSGAQAAKKENNRRQDLRGQEVRRTGAG